MNNIETDCLWGNFLPLLSYTPFNVTEIDGTNCDVMPYPCTTNNANPNVCFLIENSAVIDHIWICLY